MFIGVPREIMPGEQRVAALPSTVERLVKAGHTVGVETQAGTGALVEDSAFAEAGALVLPDAATLYERADLVLKVKQPYFNSAVGAHEAMMLRPGSVLITFLHPAAPSNHEMIKMLAERGVTSFSMDAIPRTSRAQTMDALTSMSTVTGYKAILLAAQYLARFVPMVGTAIGTLRPATVLVIGAGVVGLQAIATAKRLGAVVKCVDIRAEARDAARSLGASVEGFEVPDELALGPGGYAKALPEEWLEKERESLKPLVAKADIVISSALVPGEVAPVLITEEMVASMARGSVIVDVSVDQGGNCALTVPGEICDRNSVRVVGVQNIPGSVPVDASWLYAHNLLNFVEHLYKNGNIDWNDEIVQATLVTHAGQILHMGARKAMGLV